MNSNSTASNRRSLAAALFKAGEGDTAAFAQVYHHTSAKLFGICLRVLGNRSEAEDALQETYVNVWQRAAVYDPERSSPVTWLGVLARNKAIDRLRARAVRRSEPLGPEALAMPDSSCSASETLEAAEEHRVIARSLAKLDARQAAAIRGAFFGGATYAEMASMEGVPLGTMKSRVRRGLVHLQRVCNNERCRGA